MVTGIHRENDGPIGLKGDQPVGTKVWCVNGVYHGIPKTFIGPFL